MKRKESTISEVLGPVKIDLTDIRRIVEIISATDDGTLTIQSNVYEFDSIDDLSGSPEEELEELDVGYSSAYMGRVSISVSNRSCRLYSSTDSAVQRGVIAELKEFLAPKQQRWQGIDKMFYLAMGSLGGLGVLVIQWQVTRSFASLYILLIVLLSLIVISAVYVLTRSFRKSRIQLEEKREISSFWNRNRDKIVLAVFSTALGIIATLIVQAIIS